MLTYDIDGALELCYAIKCYDHLNDIGAIIPKHLLSAMNCFASFLVLFLILVEAAMPTAASTVPTLGECLPTLW